MQRRRKRPLSPASTTAASADTPVAISTAARLNTTQSQRWILLLVLAFVGIVLLSPREEGRVNVGTIAPDATATDGPRTLPSALASGATASTNVSVGSGAARSNISVMDLGKEVGTVLGKGVSPWPDHVDLQACLTGERRASLSLVSEEGFRCLADAILEGTTHYKISSSELRRFNRIKVSEGRIPVLYVHAGIIWMKPTNPFYQYQIKRIKTPYILITHGSDKSLPTDRDKSLFLENNTKLVHWFAQNTWIERHERLSTIPIGFDEVRWEHQLAELYRPSRQQALATPKDRLLLVNFSPQTHHSRLKALEWAENVTFAHTTTHGYDGEGTKLEQHRRWWMGLARYKFAMSPRGRGLDCHRTWELLMAGVIPIVRRSTIDPVYENLPTGAVLQVDEWDNLTKEGLEDHWERFGASLQTHDLPKPLTMRHWMDKIWKAGVLLGHNTSLVS